MNVTTEILRTFAAANPNCGSWDMFGQGWGDTLALEADTRSVLIELGFDAFDANVLMEEALLPKSVTEGKPVYIGSHRAARQTWQAGMSDSMDSVYRSEANARYM